MKKHYLLVIALLLFIAFMLKNSNNITHNKTSNAPEDNFRAFEEGVIENLIFGKWKVIRPYTILPSAFGFNRYDSFVKYDHLLDDPLVKEIVEPYNEKLIDKIIELSNEMFAIDGIEILRSPEYSLQKRDGNVYDEDIFWRYRPFHDFFEYNGNVYYYFETTNYDESELELYDMRPKGFIVSYNYIICPVHDDWIFYVLERQS